MKSFHRGLPRFSSAAPSIHINDSLNADTWDERIAEHMHDDTSAYRYIDV